MKDQKVPLYIEAIGWYGLQADPVPALECGASQQHNTGSYYHSVANQADKRVGKAEQVGLVGLGHRAATDDRVEVAVRYVAWVLGHLYLFVGYDSRTNDADYAADN